ncbi:hypothetical protein [Streptomyces sp. yara]|uniref:hypothetical protein n=1 Tax=Streptomyces sp. yara TaxID=3458421 RepID=UPI0040403883
MSATQCGTAGTGDAKAPRGRTRWGVVKAILSLPAPAVGAFLVMIAAWVLVS